MAQSGYTPILIYASGTATNVPLAANMTSSASGAELGLNYADGKLYYKNSSGVVTLLASATTVTNSFSAGSTGFTPNTATTGAVTLAGTLVVGNGGTGLTTLATGSLSYGAGTSAFSTLAIGTAGQILTVNSGATAPQWSTLSGVAVTTFSAGTTGFTPSSATSGAVTLAGTLATTNGGTGLTSYTANGVVYASGSTTLASGSVLTFDGTMLSSTKARFGTYATFGTESLQVAKANGTGVIGSAYQFAINSKTANNRAEMIMTDGSTANAFISYAPSGTAANDKLTFNLQGSDIVTVVGNGKVGIGNSSPTSTLDVTGTLSATGTTTIGPGATLVTINTGASPMLNLLGSPTGTYSLFQRNDEAGYGGRVGAGNTLYGPGAARSLGLDGFSEVSIGVAGTRYVVLTSTGLAVTGTGSYTGLLYLGGSAGTVAERLQVNRGTDDATQSSFLGYQSLTMERAGAGVSSAGDFNFKVRGTTTVTAASFNYLGLTVDAGTLTVTGTGSRGVRLKGVGAGEVAVAGDGSTYATGFAFYNSTSYATQLGGMFAYASAGALQWVSMGTAYNTAGVYVDASNKVGIGVSAPQTLLHMGQGTFGLNSPYGTGSAVPAFTAALISGEIHAGSTVGSGSDGAVLRISAGGESNVNQKSGIDFNGYNTTDGGPKIRFYAGSATPLAIMDYFGNLLVGTTDASGTAGIGFKFLPSATYSRTNQVGSTTSNSDTTHEVYSTGASAYRFYVGYGGTIFATSIVITAISDQRLKENVRDIDTGLSSIMALKPRRFDWKEGKGQDKKDVAGFIAQEFEDVFPECVNTSKAGADGIEYKNINHETLIPTLVKAIQEQQALITQLTARITALEGA